MSRLDEIAPDREFGATRSSHRWQEMPGNWDRLNTNAKNANTKRKESA